MYVVSERYDPKGGGESQVDVWASSVAEPRVNFGENLSCW